MKKAKLLLGLALPVFLLSAFRASDAGQAGFSTTQILKKMTIEKEIIINQPIEKAWKVLGTDFAHADRWASAVSHSEGTGAGFNGATCSERGCSTTMGALKEKLLQFSNESHLVSYEIAEGMPSMVKNATNTWQLTTDGADKTRLSMRMDVQIGGLMGAMMKPMMRMKLSRLGDELAEDFKFYVENEQPHPRKVKAMKKVKT